MQREERKKTLKGELKKINEFRKILTRNSKEYARKYGDEILKKIISLNTRSNKDTRQHFHHDFIYNNTHKIKIKGRKFLSNKNNLFINKAFKKLMNYSNKNINFNIINSFKIINEKEITRKNSYEKKDELNNYLKKYELIKDNITNKNISLEKSEKILNYNRYYSYGEKKTNQLKKKKKPNKVSEQIQFNYIIIYHLILIHH